MSIKKKLLITFSATLFVFILVYSLTTEFFIIKGFKELEYENIRQNSALTLRLIKLEEQNLDKMAYDWASWDQMYQFVDRQSSDFVKSNMTAKILADLNLSFVVIANKGGEIIYYETSQSKDGKLGRKLPADYGKSLKKVIPGCLSNKHKYGILYIDRGFYFIASRPVLRSDDSGPPNGALVIGRKVDKEVIDRISNIIGHEITIEHANKLGKNAPGGLKTFDVVYVDSYCVTKTLVKDIFGRPSLILKVSLPRKITKYGTTSAHLAIFAAITLGIVLGAVLLWQLKRLIFSKLDHLTGEVVEIAQSDDLARRLPEYDEDELGILVRGFNELLERASRFSEELMVSKNKYKTLFEQSPAGIFVFDTDLKIIECNESICRMLTVPKESLLGLDLRKLRHKEVIPYIEAALKGEQVKYYGHYRATTSDVQIWSSTALSPLYDQEGAIIGGMGIVEDISEIKKYEWALEESRAHLEAILESAPGYGILTTDLDFIITYFNKEAERIFGCSPDVAKGKNVNELGGSFAELMHHFLAARDTIEKGKVYEFTFTKRITCGEQDRSARVEEVLSACSEHSEGFGEDVETFSCRMSGICSNEGELLGYVLFAGDITEKLKAEKEKKELQEQLFHAQKMEAIARLSGGVAHDFNNLLTGIIGLTQLAMENIEKGSESNEILEQILTSARRGSRLTKQLLNMSRKRVIKPHTIDLTGIVGSMESMLRSVIGQDIVLDVNIPKEPIYIQADPSQVEQVLMNLVVNARDAMPSGGKLGVYIEDLVESGQGDISEDSGSYGSYVCLIVTDTGCGMNDEIQSRIFDPFFTTKPPGKGTGLGLSTVYGIITQLGGFIEVESAPGMGSKFFVYFPRAFQAVEKEKEETVPVYEKPEAPHTVSILVVEDEEAILDIISFVLKREGYRVFSAQNAEEAMKLLGSNLERVDLLIVDLIMPGMSGTELASNLKEKFPGIKIIYTSGYTEDILVQKDIIEWDAVFLEKPFSPDELLRLCAMVLQMK